MSQTDDGVEELPVDYFAYGEEYDEEEEEFGEGDEDEWSVYDADTFISGPVQNDRSTLPEDILEFDFSFGYDCRKYFNLTVADPDTLVFASGNLINFFDVPNKRISFRRSALGGGIAHIKANPCAEFNHIAIAEHGEIPLIIVYEWPSMEINCVLKEGSSRIYSHLDYSPDGLLLVSQGGEPDYLITIWNWPQRKILLRTKSYVNDVYRVKFSPYVPGQLTSCGVSHIKFWKMARTFTGLKLKGELGRFGKTEFSDILGILPMPDEKVLSGCAWGNILVWDAGLIKLEVFRTLRRKCHDGPVVQLYFSEGELWTVSMDGHVKVWWYEKIDQADPPDDDRVIQIEPTYDFFTPGLMLMCVRKRYPDPKDTTFFGQDGNGGIWIIDLNTEDTPQESVQLYKSHAGKVVDIVACPWGPFLASLGEDGRIYLYAYLERKLVFEHQFPAKGACMIWISPKIAHYGDQLVMGFDDGTLRVCILGVATEPRSLRVIQTTKPHEKSVTKIAINRHNNVLVSGGADATIFFFQILSSLSHVELVPIGYIRVPNEVTCLTWHFRNFDDLLVGCLRGEMVQVTVPHEPQDYTTVSYLLKLEAKENVFTTYKAQIRRDIKIKEIEAKKAVKVEKKRKEMEKLKAENPGLDIDEEVFLADSETEEELEPLFIPEIPNRIIWMQSTNDDTLWLSMGGYDAGYIYEYKIDQKDKVPFRFKMVDDADDIEISSYVYNYSKKYLIFAMQNGEIRVNRVNPDDFKDLSDYWTLAMHDNLNGFVPTMCFSYDERFFFTCGHDGNVFSYTFHPEDESDYIPQSLIPTVTTRSMERESVHDEANYDKLSLEQASLKKEQDRIERLANKHKELLRQKLAKLSDRFQAVLRRNKKLLPSQVIPIEELELDRRITEYLDNKMEEELALVKRKLAFDVQKSEVRMMKLRNHFVDNLAYIPIIVKGINDDKIGVKMLRQKKIPPENEEMLKIVEEKILEEEIKSRPLERPPLPPKAPPPKKPKDERLEYFLVNLSPSILKAHADNKLLRLLQKYRDRKLKWERREEEWEEFLARKPVVGVNYPEDEIALATAKATIGDYKLKSDKDYKPSQSQRETTVKKYKELLISRVKQFKIRNDFNDKVFKLREDKIRIRQELISLRHKLYEIHDEITIDQRKEGPLVPEEDESEFPERNYEINVTLIIEDDDEEAAKIYHKPAIVKKPQDLDSYERYILPTGTKKPDGKDPDDVCTLDFETLCKLADNEKKDTPWEHDIRKRRTERRLFEQDEIIEEMNKKIADFNSELERISYQRFEVDVRAKLMDLFIVTLHQELIILKKFEALENSLQEKVNQKMIEVLDMRDIIDATKEEIKEHNKEIDKLNEEGAHIHKDFVAAVMDNKFFDFLKKVFKKKYRPPKVRKDDDESSSSSSSSESSSTESEDDGASIDSREDFGLIKQDLNVCPKGCDQAVFDYTIEARTRRHQVEIKIKEEGKTIELLKKDLELHNKKVKLIEKDLNLSQDELEKFQCEKQEKLNKVRCTILMKLEQLQHLTPDDKTSNIMDTLVFSKTRLSKLYKRVEELQVETERQINRHRQNVKHLTRMSTDCKYMATTIKRLQEDILTNMKIKFGKVVDIIEIEEAMLKRSFGKDDLADLEEVMLKKIIHDLRLNLLDIKSMYIEQLKFWKDSITKTQKELTMTLRHSTSRQELLTLMTKERTDLAKSLILQEKKKAHLMSVEDVARIYKDEIDKLESIIKEQNQQLQELKDEIKLLKTKGMLLKPKEAKREPIEEEELQAWDQQLKEVEEEVEEEEQRKPFATEIIIPRTLHEKSQEVVSALLAEMLEAMDVQLTKKSTENFITQMLESVMRGLSMTELVEEMIKNLPIEPDDEQRGMIETTAEQLYVVQEPEATPEDIQYYSREIMEDIVDEVLLAKDEPESVMARLVSKLVDSLPLDFLRESSSIEFLVKRLLESHLNIQMNRVEMLRMLHTQEARNILDEILEKIFDTGVDLLYYIKDD